MSYKGLLINLIPSKGSEQSHTPFSGRRAIFGQILICIECDIRQSAIYLIEFVEIGICGAVRDTLIVDRFVF